MSFRNFTEGRAHERVCVGFDDEEPLWMDAAKWWLGHELANRYEKPTFAPGIEGPHEGNFNLWRGETHQLDITCTYYSPDGQWRVIDGVNLESRCPTLCRFLLVVICARSWKKYNYLLNWIADMIQNPMRQQNITVILYSLNEGLGKGTLFQFLRWLVGREYAAIVGTASDLAGGFNSMLLHKLLFMIDEAALAEDAKARKAVRNVQGSDEIRIEPKGVDPFMAPNYIRLMNATNKETDIRLPVSDRRHVIYQIDEDIAIAEFSKWHGRPCIREDGAQYFENVAKSYTERNEGYAFFTLMKTRDLSGWNRVKDRPKDRFYYARQFASMGAVIKTFAAVINAPRLNAVKTEDVGGWPVVINGKEVVLDQGEIAHAFVAQVIVDDMMLVDPEVRLSVTKFNEQIGKIALKHKKLGLRPTVNGQQGKEVIWLPSLRTTRKLFEVHFLDGSSYEWEDGPNKWWPD